MMKHFDIEQLERKTPELSEDFFLQMQANVLSKTVWQTPQIAPERSNTNRWYYAAAAVAAIFGAGYFVNYESAAEALDSQKQGVEMLAQNTPVQNNEVEPIISDFQEIEPNLTLAEDYHQTNEAAPKVYHAAAPVKARSKPQMVSAKMEDVLDAMPENTVAELGRNTEQDVYLDLYN